MKPPTIIDVAKAAYVSKSTAAAALCGKGSVHPETRARVLKAAEALGYAPSFAARAMRGDRPPVIAIATYFSFASLAHTAMVWSACDALGAEGFRVVLYPHLRSGLEDKWISQSRSERMIGGAIILGEGLLSKEVLGRLVEDGLGVVQFGYSPPGAHSIVVDDELGGRLAARALLKRTRRLMLAVGASQGPGDLRVKGFKAEAVAQGLTLSGIKVLTVKEGGFEAAYALGKKTVFAQGAGVFSAWGDASAIGLARAMEEQGKKVGKDVFLVGYDDMEFSAFFKPGLSTIKQPLQEVGRLAAQLSIQAYRGELQSLQHVQLKPHYVRRGTC